MKGTPETPQCGFSRASIQILGLQGVDPKKFVAFNVLEDAELRQGIVTISVRRFAEANSYLLFYRDQRVFRLAYYSTIIFSQRFCRWVWYPDVNASERWAFKALGREGCTCGRINVGCLFFFCVCVAGIMFCTSSMYAYVLFFSIYSRFNALIQIQYIQKLCAGLFARLSIKYQRTSRLRFTNSLKIKSRVGSALCTNQSRADYDLTWSSTTPFCNLTRCLAS